MDDFISVLRKGLAGLGKGPVLIVAGFVAATVGAVGLIQFTGPGSAMLSDTAGTLPVIAMMVLVIVLPLVVLPFVLGGALGHAIGRAAGGSPGWPEFFAAARKSYRSLFFGGLIAFIVTTILGMIAASVMYMSLAGSLAICAVTLPALLLVFICLMAIEFYDIAIVAEGVDHFKGFAASVDFVRKHAKVVVPYFIIVLLVKGLITLPLTSASFVRMTAEIASNYSYVYNDTANMTLNMTYINDVLVPSQNAPYGLSSVLLIAVLQIAIQAIIFAFVVSYKAEFYRWAGGIKPKKKITDFDYDFSEENSVNDK
jgi:hypothetical protein